METKSKKVEVARLRGKSSSNFGYCPETNKLHMYTNGEDPDNILDNLLISQHLYFISDEKIKEGDWCIDMIGVPLGAKPKLRKATKDFADDTSAGEDAFKIITTTDNNLNLPKPSQAFIEKYVKLGGIDEVMIEYIQYYFVRDSLHDGFKGEWNEISFEAFNYSKTNPESLHHNYKEYKEELLLKTNSHNEIKTTSIKNKYSREEVKKLLRNCIIDISNIMNIEISEDLLQDFYKENL